MSGEEHAQWIRDQEAANPEIRERRERVERERREFEARMILASQPIIRDLRALGYPVTRLADMVYKVRGPYPDAVPVLLDHLQREPPYPEACCIELARSLTVKEACGIANKALIRRFRSVPPQPGMELYRWQLGNALTVTAELDDVDELIELATTPPGRARSAIAETLVRFVGRRPDIVPVLDLLRDDPDIGQTVQRLLARKAVAKAREKLGGAGGEADA